MLNLATARAGNVIGGGDWSKDRILTDVIKSVKNKKKLIDILEFHKGGG